MKFVAGGTSHHEVTGNTRAEDFVTEVNSKHKTHRSHTVLVFGSKMLRFGTLAEYGITDGSVLNMCVRTRVYQLFVATKDDIRTTYFLPSVPVETTVAEVKEKLQELSGIPTADQRLYGYYDKIEDGELDNDKTLQDIGITFHLWKLLLLKRLRPGSEIIIRDEDSVGYSLTIHPNETVLEVRTRCENIYGFPPEHGCLKLRGDFLEDNKKLSETTVEPNCVVDALPFMDGE